MSPIVSPPAVVHFPHLLICVQAKAKARMGGVEEAVVTLGRAGEMSDSDDDDDNDGDGDGASSSDDDADSGSEGSFDSRELDHGGGARLLDSDEDDDDVSGEADANGRAGTSGGARRAAHELEIVPRGRKSSIGLKGLSVQEREALALQLLSGKKPKQ